MINWYLLPFCFNIQTWIFFFFLFIPKKQLQEKNVLGRVWQGTCYYVTHWTFNRKYYTHSICMSICNSAYKTPSSWSIAWPWRTFRMWKTRGPLHQHCYISKSVLVDAPSAASLSIRHSGAIYMINSWSISTSAISLVAIDGINIDRSWESDYSSLYNGTC